MTSLTVRTVQSLIKAGEAGKFGDGRGLYLKVPPKGEAYWMLRYTIHSKRREITLGKVSLLSLSEARSLAEDTRRKVATGDDPIAEKKLNRPKQLTTVDGLFEDWHKDLVKRLKHPHIPERVYRKDIAPTIGRLALVKVNPLDVRSILQKITDSGRPTISNDALLYMKQLFDHGIKLGLLQSNPAMAFKVNDAGGIEKSRERALSLEEIGQVFKVFREHSDSFSRDNYLACALLLLLAVRKSELTEAPWAEFDLDEKKWSLPKERSKSGVGIVVPLSPLAIKILEELKVRAFGSDYVFPNRRVSTSRHMGKDTLNRAIAKLFGVEPGKKKQPPNVMGNIEYFTVHDLRRTCRSLLASLSVPPHVAERCLNHKLKGVEAIYDRYDYFEERKKALYALSDLMCNLILP
ncbi:TPA: integrase arm-type DNA-binding domain-containing protein [Escherichia coli]|uniref:tyrosine-type recombinase/integrase n=1 Tax=Enterobacteriaceae TaxID=543 RepID=UPI000390175F|nr:MULTISPECIES: site-specific integrase [Enterobacteriaceae]ELY4929552.1 integrase arm-type DNA-binding domain-containing protein [Salmonella enterica]MBH2566871.1 integrase arm-type DNA-binding domain-containing protein [Serratia marcescens]HBZ7810785.1 integrase arm-type DNA-binding domain-containing protein [Klebsiella variicola subsp. variicola]EJS7135172.1 integrase arm-type DNA-binding domain-containing protein [Escherichia coli]ELY4930984.1 integrase arm-type DNA-binding domain-contain